MMKTGSLALLLCTCAFSQENPLMQSYMARYNTMKQNLVEAAEAMPAEHYSFKLTSGQRAFGEWVGHTVMLMHTSCAAMKSGSAPAMDHSKHTGTEPKPALQEALKGAAATCDSILGGMTDAQALAGGKAAPVGPMLGMLVNMASHYGNMVGYMRSKGITPPSTARSQKR
jgi:hypothetical protein